MTIDVLKTLSKNDSRCINGTVPVRQSVRRSLFGKVDHDESMEFLRKELDAIAESQKKQWNFDFQEEKPLEPCNYEWTPVKPNDVVPRPYALSRFPYLFEHTENTPCDPSYLPTESQSRSQVVTNTIVSKTKLKQTLIDGYIKSKKRPGTVERQSKFKTDLLEPPSNKKICLTPKKTQK